MSIEHFNFYTIYKAYLEAEESLPAEARKQFKLFVAAIARDMAVTLSRLDASLNSIGLHPFEALTKVGRLNYINDGFLPGFKKIFICPFCQTKIVLAEEGELTDLYLCPNCRTIVHRVKSRLNLKPELEAAMPEIF